MLRAMIVDDEELAVERIEMILKHIGQIDVCHTSLNPWDAYDFAKTNRIDVAFLDISMPEINGMKLSSLLLELHPSIHVVFVTGYDHYAVQAFDIGALDYVTKPVTAQRMLKTVERIRQRYRSEEEEKASHTVTRAEEHSEQIPLTEQELRIVQLLADGLSNKAMAVQLNITTETVKFHMKNVFRKLHVNNRVQALQRVMKLKIKS